MLKLLKIDKTIKAKVGLFFGYDGHSFQGMQYQRDTKNTIENTIHSALCDNGFVLKTNMSSLRRIRWSRACRTDKRVHALCNGIAASLEFDQRYVTDWQERIVDLNKVSADLNAALPKDIRIFAMRRLGKAFDMRHQACSRIYHYICPLQLFQTKLGSPQQQKMSFLQKAYLIRNLQTLAKQFEGTHSFHNFTRGYKPGDAKCLRYIKSVSVEKVIAKPLETAIKQQGSEVAEKSKNVEFLRFTIVGQSFIYNQIRKMIGLLIKIYYEELQAQQVLKQAFGHEKYNVYLAPAEGLYLNRMTFTTYNRYKQEQHLRIELTAQQQSRIKQFREHIESKIFLAELQEGVFSKWLAMHSQEIEEDEPVQTQNDQQD